MTYFKVITEDGDGGYDHYTKGVMQRFGPPLGTQTPESLSVGSEWVTITYSEGAKVRIPASRILEIRER